MANGDNDPAVDPGLDMTRVDEVLAELLEQTRQEPVSPRLRELALRLQLALKESNRETDSTQG